MDIVLSDGHKATAAVPSGASTGKRSVLDLLEVSKISFFFFLSHSGADPDQIFLFLFSWIFVFVFNFSLILGSKS